MTSGLKKMMAVFSILLVLGGTVSARVLTLDDCIQLALKNNPDIVQAKNQVKVARATVWQSFGAFLPDLAVGVSGSQTNTEPSDNSDGVSKSYSISASSGITLFNGGSNIFNYLGSRADKCYYEFLAEKTVNSMILSVKTTYFAYLAALRSKQASEEAVKRGEEQYKLASSKYEVGSASKSDVLKAQVQYGNDKLDFIQAENSIKTTRANLAYLIGVDVNSDIDFSADFKPKDYNETEEAALKYGMEHQPALLAAEKNLTAAKYDLRSTRGNYFPTLSFSVGRGWSNNRWSRVNDLSKEDGQWSFRTSLSFTIFDGFSREASLTRSKANLQVAKTSYSYAKNDVANQVKQAFLDITRAREALNVAQDNEAAAKEDMALVQEKYNLGAATILEMMDAQVSLITAQNDKIQAEFDYNIAVATLENAIGAK